MLDGREHRLDVNDGPNTLHGGAVGFDKAVWVGESDGAGVTLRHVGPDGDQGFPGRLDVSVRYAVLGGTTLAIGYEATCDAATVVNLTNHAYFNLAGGGDVLDHVVAIAADRFLAVDATLIPEGPPRDVAGTPFDFRMPARIGARIDADDEQLRFGRGYDHCFVLEGAPTGEPRLAARVAAGGLVMTVETTEPCVQLYTGNMLGPPFARRAGLCLETQHAPDSPNRPDLPTTVLRPGETFRSRTLYRFAGGQGDLPGDRGAVRRRYCFLPAKPMVVL